MMHHWCQFYIKIVRYSNSAEEPNPTPRQIDFTVSDGIFFVSASLTLQLQVIDDNPTMVRFLPPHINPNSEQDTTLIRTQ